MVHHMSLDCNSQNHYSLPMLAVAGGSCSLTTSGRLHVACLPLLKGRTGPLFSLKTEQVIFIDTQLGYEVVTNGSMGTNHNSGQLFESNISFKPSLKQNSSDHTTMFWVLKVVYGKPYKKNFKGQSSLTSLRAMN